MPVSVHYRLCLVTVCMKVLQSGRLSDFQRGQIVGVHSAGISNEMATWLGVSTAAVFKVKWA